MFNNSINLMNLNANKHSELILNNYEMKNPNAPLSEIKKKNNKLYLDELEKQNDILSLNDSFDNLLKFSDEYDKINKLSSILDNLFVSNNSFLIKSNDTNNINDIQYVIFNHIYEKEFERGNIEYKRSLESYDLNDKTNKLIRQIHWRIYEGVVNTDKECCYYIIGIEDSGRPSFLTKKELLDSLYFIQKSISDTEITYSYLYVKNTLLDFEYIIVKFCLLETNCMDYF